MKHLGTVTLHTNRLTLRRFVVEDVAAAYTNWCSEDKVTQYLSWNTHNNEDITNTILGNWISSYSSDSTYHWAIELKDISQPIGTISVVGIMEYTQRMSIGYCIGSRWWGQGIATEALTAVIGFLFREVGANRLEAVHDICNLASGSVMVKCGMTKEGTLRQYGFVAGKAVDVDMYSILASEYKIL